MLNQRLKVDKKEKERKTVKKEHEMIKKPLQKVVDLKAASPIHEENGKSAAIE